MRHGIRALYNRFPLGALAILGVLAGFAFAGDQPAKPAEHGAPARAAFRYGGKPFAYWRDSWRTELKAEPRMEALQALAAFGQNGYAREATAVILEVLRGYDAEHLAFASAVEEPTDPDQKVVQKADWALHKIGEAAAPVLLVGLHDSHKPLRWYVFKRLFSAWVFHFPESFAPALIQATEQRDREAAALAAELLLTGDRAHCALGVALHSRQQTNELVRALTRLVAVDPSERGSEDKVTTAAMLLADLGPAARAAIPALEKAWRTHNQSAFCRAASALALATMKAEPAKMIPELRVALQDKDMLVRAVAIRALGMYGADAHSALAAIRHALEDSEECVRLAAVLALGNIENNPNRTLDDFVTASQAGHDAVSLASLLEFGAVDKERLSEPWFRVLVARQGVFPLPANPHERFVLAHANVAPAVRTALPVIKEAVRTLAPAGNAAIPGPPLFSESALAKAPAQSNTNVAAAIAAALKKMPLEPAPTSKR